MLISMVFIFLLVFSFTFWLKKSEKGKKEVNSLFMKKVYILSFKSAFFMTTLIGLQWLSLARFMH